MKLLWTRSAAQDRKEIRSYIAESNPSAALSLDLLISEKAGYLVDHPELGRSGRVSGTRELVVHRSYLLVYDTRDGWVRILRVLHTKIEYP